MSLSNMILFFRTEWIAFMIGMFAWTLIEYCFHRWLGHDARFRPNFFSHEHIRHHSEGNYFSPLWKKFLTAVVVLTLLGSSAYFLVGNAGLVFISGVVIAYLTYEVFHFSHHVHPGLTWYGKRMRRHHFHHHFANPKMNHGVTTPLWDWILSTYEPPKDVLVVPDKLKMRWLVDPQTNEVYPQHAQRYQVKRKRNLNN